jgi:hypothetical protein
VTPFYLAHPFKRSSFKPLPDTLAELPSLLLDVKGKGKAAMYGPDQPHLDALVAALEMLEEGTPATTAARHILLVAGSDIVSRALAESIPNLPCWYNDSPQNDGITWTRLLQLLRTKDVKFSLIALAFLPKLESFYRAVRVALSLFNLL